MNFASIANYNSYFKNLPVFGLGSSTPEETIQYELEDLINRTSGLGEEEKDTIFSYIKLGDRLPNNRTEYITNIIIIFNSFFEYGFLNNDATHSSNKDS